LINWNKVRYFKREEFDDPNYPGSGENIDGILLFMLDRLRHETGWPIITHWKVGGCVDVDGTHGHAPHSYHLKKSGSRAVDFHFGTTASSREQFYNVIKSGFTGIGVYIDVWKWNGHVLPIAFHVDIRPKTETQIWTCRKKGEYIYVL